MPSTPIFKHSAIYVGQVIHKRFLPKKHSFNSTLYMLALDVDEIENAKQHHGVFGFAWYHPLRFVEKDYIRSEPDSLSGRIKNKVVQLGGYEEIERILMLIQVRCFGLYFSPVNFYFCYNREQQCTQMLAEVSNTPWNERHYYLVDLMHKEQAKVTDKVFQVSPFMDLDMSYSWHIRPPLVDSDRLMVKIENKRTNQATSEVEKLFEACLILKKQSFSKRNLLGIWTQLPIMTVKIVTSIYWQALRLYLKKIPFIGYQKISE